MASYNYKFRMAEYNRKRRGDVSKVYDYYEEVKEYEYNEMLEDESYFLGWDYHTGTYKYDDKTIETRIQGDDVVFLFWED